MKPETPSSPDQHRSNEELAAVLRVLRASNRLLDREIITFEERQDIHEVLAPGFKTCHGSRSYYHE